MTLTLVQISDTHLSDEAPQRMQDLKNCINAINNLPHQPDLVVHTGDITHNGLAQEYKTARALLNELNVPYYVMAGNRDSRAELLAEFSEPQYQLPKKGFVQYSVEHYPVRLIMVDTISEESNKGALCSERLEHLGALLAADTKKPTALFLHHTPYEATGIPDPYQYDNWEDVDNLTQLLSQYSNICGMYCGHVHRFIDGEIAGIPARAISCLAGDLRKGEVTDEERKLPVFRELTLPA